MSPPLPPRMEHPPLPRHPALQPLSREHFGGLVLARDLFRAAADDALPEQRRAVLRRLAPAWLGDLEPHFADEERLLGPLIGRPEDLRRLIREHREIERLVQCAAAAVADADPAPGTLRRLAQLLHDHIRWEERELFPAVEAAMSADTAERIGRATAAVEAERPGARRRRDLHPGPDSTNASQP